jgi:hypothetical protein
VHANCACDCERVLMFRFYSMLLTDKDCLAYNWLTNNTFKYRPDLWQHLSSAERASVGILFCVFVCVRVSKIALFWFFISPLKSSGFRKSVCEWMNRWVKKRDKAESGMIRRHRYTNRNRYIPTRSERRSENQIPCQRSRSRSCKQKQIVSTPVSGWNPVSSDYERRMWEKKIEK